jgi:hypothetical protein
MKKEKEILKYSNPKIVLKLLKKYYGTDQLFLSSNKNKKYMILTPENKWVHFGAMGYEDYTKHQDEHRRKLFQTRNHKWKFSKKYTPAHLSYYLLW